MFGSANPIDSMSRGTRQFMLGGGGGSYKNVCNLSLSQRIGRVAERFTENFEEAPKKVFNDGGKISIRGPGRNNFICISGSTIKCLTFNNTTEYRESASFEKVDPICGTPSYFSIRLIKSPALHLIAIGTDNGGVKFDDISASVDVQDGACWTFDKSGATEPNSGMLINKRFPNLALTVVDENTIRLQMPEGSDKTRYQLLEERALSSYNGIPAPRPASYSDFDIRPGWNLADMSRSYGPLEFRSYELQPRAATTVENCAAEVNKHPEANGFVYFPNGGERGFNCRIKVGGYWPINSLDEGKRSNIISGKLNAKAGSFYKDPSESFEIRKGWNVGDRNNKTGENPSYELDISRVGSAEDCAYRALQNPKANSFVFIPNEQNNCRLKTGGFWPKQEKPDSVWSSLTSGILR